MENYEVLITNPGSTYKYDKGLLKKARKLRYIITPSTGTDHIDVEYCKSRKIKNKVLAK